MDPGYCLECKRNTVLVLDRKSGDTICSECGLILEDHYVDEYVEWRTFTDDHNDSDPNRVGGHQNPFLATSNLSIMISKPQHGGGGGRGSDDFFHHRLANTDKAFIQGFESIATIADRLSLVKTIKNRANEIYKNVENQVSCRGRKLDAVLAACLYIACREERLSRTFKEISEAADGVSGKEILKAAKFIQRLVEVNMNTGQHAVELVSRFCSNLGMKNQAIKAVEEAFKKSEDFVIRRNPQSILAAIIYIVSQLSDGKKKIRDVARAVDLAEGTIRKSYKDVYPLASRLIPSWYAKEEDISRIFAS
ncbi:TFIIB domain-containing protein/TF_Zn_Ribbon domain-containing protein [Cephalotus follicularis]|uniref:TFIIB domain-containing protein/TF_Zn_Ribbon domain-containing protein n=1 Tax=Cephalotus follicularis TaxID=3775 RepID=A0A1Q3BCZ5_CEPFO|nr:TFIIB domain-containing protein/TF_Zn_Ribbon domain-containing protein [Cephalotus follicularis]